MGESASEHSFIAILNHNLATATGKIRVSASDTKSHIENDDLTGATAINCTEVVNAGGADGSSNIFTPAADGHTLITCAESDLRYWGIQFEGNTTNTGNATNGTWGSTDLYVGGIMIGEYYDMPHAPDLSVNRQIIFDQVKQMESAGGQRFSNMSSWGRVGTTSGRSPFNQANFNYTAFGGRLAYDLNFSFLSSSDLMPDEYRNNVSMIDDDSVVVDVWDKTHGPHTPFIFSVDGESAGDNAESEHIFARFAQNSLNMSQVANDYWNVSMRIEEEF